MIVKKKGGETGIRTLDMVTCILPFQGSGIDHSAIFLFIRNSIILDNHHNEIEKKLNSQKLTLKGL